jgi:hypothetical protein
LKTILISSALSLAIGFTFGWLIKSASADLDSFVPQTGQNTPTPRPPGSAPDSPPARSRPGRPSLDTGPTKRTPTGTAPVPEAAKRADRAKWMRLIEVLGLDGGQAKALEAAMAEAMPKSENGQSPEIAYLEAGARLEKNILALLNADQRKAFTDMQRRAADNRIELSAQQTYSQELGELDLSPEQRGQALDLLRSRADRNSADIPSSTRLLLTGSLLPIGDLNFSEDAIRLLRQLSPQDSGDVTLDKLAEKRRAEAEEKAKLFEGVLTPAQLELYRSRLSQTPDILDQLRSGE